MRVIVPAGPCGGLRQCACTQLERSYFPSRRRGCRASTVLVRCITQVALSRAEWWGAQM